MDDLPSKRVTRYIPRMTPERPLPWHNHDNRYPDRPHVKTEQYARYILDALAGDERRSDLRHVYRFFMTHQKPAATWHVTARWALIEAVKRYMYVLPPQRINDYLASKGA